MSILIHLFKQLRAVMKMFALRGEKKKEMELPGDFFVDSMSVALPRVTGLAGTRSCCHCSARGWWPVLGWVGSCHWWNWEPGEHRELQASRSTQGSRIRPRFLPRGDGSIPGDVGLRHSPVVPAHVGAAPVPSSSTRETLEEFPLV